VIVQNVIESTAYNRVDLDSHGMTTRPKSSLKDDTKVRRVVNEDYV